MKNLFNKVTTTVSNAYYKGIAAVLSLAFSIAPAHAQGMINMANNMTRFFQVATQVVIAGGVLGGIGVIGWAVSQMIKKGGDRGEDITWMSIGLKFVGGAFLLALSWVGVSVLETLGGNSSNVGGRI
jgi:hypothetical protein